MLSLTFITVTGCGLVIATSEGEGEDKDKCASSFDFILSNFCMLLAGVPEDDFILGIRSTMQERDVIITSSPMGVSLRFSKS